MENLSLSIYFCFAPSGGGGHVPALSSSTAASSVARCFSCPCSCSCSRSNFIELCWFNEFTENPKDLVQVCGHRLLLLTVAPNLYKSFCEQLRRSEENAEHTNEPLISCFHYADYDASVACAAVCWQRNVVARVIFVAYMKCTCKVCASLQRQTHIVQGGRAPEQCIGEIYIWLGRMQATLDESI